MQVLKLENMPASTAGGGTASVLTMNQTLEGHAGAWTCPPGAELCD